MPRVLVVDADPALAGLLDEWLAALGVSVDHESVAGAGSQQRYDLAIIDLPFPRQGGAERMARIAREHPDMPIIAVSAAFFPGIPPRGAVARELGVALVLPKPLSQRALFGAVGPLLGC